MKKLYNSTDEYYLWMFDKIMKIAPLTGLGALLTFTGAKLIGGFPNVSIVMVIVFDLACLSYFVIAHVFKKIGITKNGEVSIKSIYRIEIMLGAIVIFQWNLITYIFPTRTFWGIATMFVLLNGFFFHSRIVLGVIGALSVSIAISWVLIGDKLLPVYDESFSENFIMSVVALTVSFAVVYLFSFFAEKFTILANTSHKSLVKQNKNLETLGGDIIDFTADIIEERDATSGSHVKRLKIYTRMLAEQVAKDCPEYGLDESRIEKITRACVLHDVGKISIPDSILLKPGKLTEEEFEIIKSHTIYGARIVDKLPDSIGEDYKKACMEICLFHHEKYDGKGYPNGLKGDEIPIAAQIVSVVDCFDALTNERPYKNALPREMAINMIKNGECGAFSEKMMNCLEACRNRFIYQ